MNEAIKYVPGECPKCGQPMGEVPDPMPEGWVCFLCEAKQRDEQAQQEIIRARLRANPIPYRDPFEPRVPLPSVTVPDTRSKKQRWAMYYSMKRRGL